MSDPIQPSTSVHEKGPLYSKLISKVSDTSEGGLETIIFEDMLARGWLAGNRNDYDRQHCVGLAKLKAFLDATQPEVAAELKLDSDNPTRRAFLARLEKEVAARGVVDVLRHGIKHQKYSIDLFYVTPSVGNANAAARYAENRFSVTRQLHFSLDESKLSLDLAIFIHGLPVSTFELKNSLTKQNVDHAIRQYCNDRNPRERLFGFGRCMVHFAIDDSQVMMCTHLKGKKSWFLPFNKGHNDGAGIRPQNGSGFWEMDRGGADAIRGKQF
jgi:type I restriction enzyme R subunit